MTMRLDLRTLPRNLGRTFLRPDLFGCADCGQWFQFARQLVQHDCEASSHATITTPGVYQGQSGTGTQGQEACDA